MPVVADAGRGRRLVDAGGATLATFEAHERQGVPLADLLEPAEGVPRERVVAAVLRDLPGWRVAGDAALGRLLVAAGAAPRRHAHVMSRDLIRDPAPPDWLDARPPAGVRLTPADRPAADLVAACDAAYPADHPDFADLPEPVAHEAELEGLLSGREMGPLLRCSGLAVGEAGEVLGAILVNGSPGAPPLGGPWISQVFRRPDAPGLGGPLIRRALALATRDGLPAVGLAVTHANPARAVYAALGFAERHEAFNVQLGPAV